MAYKLELPPGAVVHPVFHVSQLKLSPGSQQVAPVLPSDFAPLQVPVRVLQRRWSAGDRSVEQGLIQWSHAPLELATWEPLDALRQQFPRAPAWGHAGSEDRGNVSTPLPAGPATTTSPSGLPHGSLSSGRPKRIRRPNQKYADSL